MGVRGWSQARETRSHFEHLSDAWARGWGGFSFESSSMTLICTRHSHCWTETVLWPELIENFEFSESGWDVTGSARAVISLDLDVEHTYIYLQGQQGDKTWLYLVYSLLNIPVTQFTNPFPSIHGLVLPIFIYHLLFLANQLPTFQHYGRTSSLWHLGPLLYVSLCQEGRFTSLLLPASQPLWSLRPSFFPSRKSLFPLLPQHSCMVRELPWESPANRASLWMIIYPSVLLPLLSKLSLSFLKAGTTPYSSPYF